MSDNTPTGDAIHRQGTPAEGLNAIRKAATEFDRRLPPASFERLLAAHDAEVAATALELAADDVLVRFSSDSANMSQHQSAWLRRRAAAIRSTVKETNQ